MKVLLINANPVVGKLVTLSAQKTGDELTSASSIEEVTEGKYDLVMMDDNCYTQELFEELKSKVSFSQSCFIGSRGSVKPEGFSREFNKPFLPTDLVDTFMEISSNMGSASIEEEAGIEESLESDEFMDELDELALSGESDERDEELGFDELMDESEEAEEEIPSLDDTLEDFEEELVESQEAENKSILDEEDLKEVKELLEDTEEIEESEEDEFEELEDEENLASASFADEATLDEINEALSELDEESEEELLLEDETEENGFQDIEEDLADLFDDLDEESEDRDVESVEEISLANKEINELLKEEVFEDLEEDAEPDEAAEEETVAETAIPEEVLNEIEEEFDEETQTPAQEEEISDTEDGDELEDLFDVEDEALSDESLAGMFDETEKSEAWQKSGESPEEEGDELLEESDLPEEKTVAKSGVDEELLSEEKLEEDPGMLLEDAEEVSGDEIEENEEEIDLSALNDQIEAALSELDEDDLLGEIDEADLGSLEDDFSSISEKDFKIALGEADEEELDIEDELGALEFMDEDEEEEPELIVGQSEFASLNEEALNEAMGELEEIENEHPELDEIDAFVDQIPVEGTASEEMSLSTASDDSIAALEKLIATLKQGNVKEALKGMDMNIKISFSEKDK